jgi:hypothetical protein
VNEMNREKLVKIINQIIKDNILSNKELRQKIMKVLANNNDTRRVVGLATNLLEGKAEDIKDEDVGILIQNLSELINVDLDFINTDITKIAELAEQNIIDEDKTLSDNYKITELYNKSLIKIQKLEDELQEKNSMAKKLEQMESKLKRFESLNIEKVLEENIMYAEMFKITGTQIIEVPDEDIDALYIRYKTKGIKEYRKAFITNNEVIPKSYYDLKGGK